MIRERKASFPQYGYNSTNEAIEERSNAGIPPELMHREVDGKGILI